jgi:hypothetical protein
MGNETNTRSLDSEIQGAGKHNCAVLEMNADNEDLHLCIGG